MQRPLGTHLPGYLGNTPQGAWASHTQAIAPTGNGLHLQQGKQLKTPFCSILVTSRPWVLCQDAEVYQQCLLCDSTTEIHTRYAWAYQSIPRPGRRRSASARHCPKPLHSISSSPSFCHHAGRNSCCLTNITHPSHPDKPFGVYDARDRPSFSLMLTHCATC